MMPSHSSFENSALVAASLAESRRQNHPLAGGQAVWIWYTVLGLTGGSPPAAFATAWNSLKMLRSWRGGLHGGEKPPVCWRRVDRRRWPGCEPLQRYHVQDQVCRQINN
jgi:hypothetical protein